MKFISQNQLRKELHVSPNTIQRWVAEGLPVMVWGTRDYRFDPEKVKQWLEVNFYVN